MTLHFHSTMQKLPIGNAIYLILKIRITVIFNYDTTLH